jgi:hypothetical protein
MSSPEKVLFSAKLIHCEIFDPEVGAGFTIIYRDKQRMTYGKRVHIHKFIRNKEYSLIKDKAGKIDHLLPVDAAGEVTLSFVPAKRQRVKSASYDLADLQMTSPTARGSRMAPKPVAKMQYKVADPPRAKQAAARRKAPAKKPSSDDDGQGKLL